MWLAINETIVETTVRTTRTTIDFEMWQLLLHPRLPGFELLTTVGTTLMAVVLTLRAMRGVEEETTPRERSETQVLPVLTTEGAECLQGAFVEAPCPCTRASYLGGYGPWIQLLNEMEW